MAVAAGSSFNSTTTNGATPTCTVVSESAVGELMVVTIFTRESAGGTVSISSGWNAITNTSGSNGCFAVWWRVKQSGDSNPTITLSGHTSSNNASGDTVAMIWRSFTGFNAADPIGNNTGGSTTSSQDSTINVAYPPAYAYPIVIIGKMDDFSSLGGFTSGSYSASSFSNTVAASTSGGDAGIGWSYLTNFGDVLSSSATIDSQSITITGGASNNSQNVVVHIKSLPPDINMTSTNGSFTLSGQNANLISPIPMTAANGSFTLSGQTANLLADKLMVADNGSFTLSGQTANLLLQIPMIADNGSFTHSGQTANLLLDYLMTANNGSFALAGQAANLIVNISMTADNGSFTLSGQNATLTISGGAPTTGNLLTFLFALNLDSAGTPDITMTADHGAFTLSGQAVNLLLDIILTGANGSFTLSGQNANLLLDVMLTASHGSFTLAGQDATLLKDYLMTASHGSFTLTPQDTALRLGGQLVMLASAGGFTLSGQNVNLLADYLLSADNGSFALNGQAVTFSVLKPMTAGTGYYNLSFQDTAFNMGLKKIFRPILRPRRR